MKPNVFFLIIDSLRSDKFYGKTKTSTTINLDNLINNGTFFSNFISASDTTLLSWSSLFTSKYAFKTGIRSSKFNKLNSDLVTLFQILEKNNYTFFGFLPSLSDTIGLFPKFSNSDCIYDSNQNLSDELGEKIIEQINSCRDEPWFCCAHIMDLHYPIKISEKFNSSQYGETIFERAVSELDEWIGKLIKKINFENTILIITADHGCYIDEFSIDDSNFVSSAENQKLISKYSKKIPNFLNPIKNSIFFKIESNRKQKKIESIKNLELKSHERRGFLAGRADKDHFLYDENIRIPLLFSGYNIPKNKQFFNQIRSIDLMPTILDILEIPLEHSIDGISFSSIFYGAQLPEQPAFIESTPLMLSDSNDVIGMRTSKFKYFRDKDDPKNRVHLFDLINDPFEDNNITQENPLLVSEMENLISEIYQKTNSEEKLDDSKKIEEELRKLGYL